MVIMTSIIDSIEIGCRIESDGSYGTVRYKGDVPPTKGVWLGVEWDDPTRGKHNGSHEGHTYFETSHPTSGSFIRPKKANTGLSFVEALEDRYGQVEDESGGIIEEEMFVLGNNQQHTTVEVVGAKSVNKQQSQLDRLKEVVFRAVPVSGLGREVNLGNILCSITELEMSRTLLSSWQAVADITKTLTSLKSLNVSANKLSFSESVTDLQQAFKQVKSLRINRMGYTWEEVLKCTVLFTSLEELHCCFNNIQHIPQVDSSLDKVRVLNLESNILQQWENVLKFGHLPVLETLILNDMGLTNIQFPDTKAGEKSSHFCTLKNLYLISNNISDWASIDQLDKLRSLRNLFIKKNPVTQVAAKMTEESIRYLIIAKITSIQVLNRTEITKEERQGAEYDYLKMFGKDWRDAGGNQDKTKNKPCQQFCDKHPKYQELIERQGAPDDSLFKVFSSALKNSLISVSIQSPNRPDKPVITKKLPVTMTVQKFKALLQRLYKADSITMKVTYTSKKMKDQEIEMDADQREIGYFSIEDGDNVIVSW